MANPIPLVPPVISTVPPVGATRLISEKTRSIGRLSPMIPSRASRSMPGTGTCASIRTMMSIPRMKRMRLRMSGARNALTRASNTGYSAAGSSEDAASASGASSAGASSAGASGVSSAGASASDRPRSVSAKIR